MHESYHSSAPETENQPSRFSFLTRNVRALDLSETNDLFGGYIRRCETTTYDYSTKKDLSVKQLKIVKDK